MNNIMHAFFQGMPLLVGMLLYPIISIFGGVYEFLTRSFMDGRDRMAKELDEK